MMTRMGYMNVSGGIGTILLSKVPVKGTVETIIHLIIEKPSR